MGSHRRTGHAKTKRVAAVAGSVVVALVVAACSSGSSATNSGSSTTGSGPSGTPYYLGAELSLSGTYASFEVPMLQGLQVAVQDINKSGGVLGHPVAIDYQSDASDTTKVQPALQSIFSSDKTGRFIYMLPNVLPPVTDTVLQYTQQYGIPSFDPGSGGDIFNVAIHPYNYSIYPANTEQIPAYVAAFEKVAGSASAIKLGVLADTQVSDTQLAGWNVAATKQVGGTVVDQESVAPGATDVSVQMTKLKDAGANVVLIQSSGNVPVEAAQALQALNWTTAKLVISPAAVNAQTQQAIPQAVASQVFTLGEQIYLRNSAGTGPEPQYAAFAKELAKTNGGITDMEISANVRDSALLDAWAVNQAKSTAVAKVTKVLDNLGTKPPPTNLMVWMPNPLWTATDHNFDHADLSTNFWALISPATEVQGTLPGQKLTVSSQLQQIGKQVQAAGSGA